MGAPDDMISVHPVTVARLLWADAGQPAPKKKTSPTGPQGARCYLCGDQVERAVHTTDAFGPGFTDQAMASCPSSSWVCCACVWLMGEKPPNTFRLWSVVYREDRPAALSNPKAVYPHGPHTHCTSKSDVTEIVDVLLDPPEGRWVCAVADSGQIHILPWSTTNVGSGEWTVRHERLAVTATPADFALVLYHASALLAAGFIREDLEVLDPHPGKLAKHGIGAWREHAEPLKQWRRGGLFALVLSLTRKETYAATRDRAWARLDGRSAIADRSGSGARHDGVRDHGADQPHGLVAAREGGTEGVGREVDHMGRTRQHDGEQARDRDTSRRVVQGDLFARAEQD
jgi:hypothetical protein